MSFPTNDFDAVKTILTMLFAFQYAKELRHAFSIQFGVSIIARIKYRHYDVVESMNSCTSCTALHYLPKRVNASPTFFLWI
jgi:hypothetical protein